MLQVVASDKKKESVKFKLQQKTIDESQPGLKLKQKPTLH